MNLSLKNSVLKSLSELLQQNKSEIIAANTNDMDSFPEMDDSMKDRLKVDLNKIDGMIKSLKRLPHSMILRVRNYIVSLARMVCVL